MTIHFAYILPPYYTMEQKLKLCEDVQAKKARNMRKVFLDLLAVSFGKFIILNPILYGLRLPPIPYGGPYGPLSEIPENGRLGLKLLIYNEDGLKFQKKPNQFHTKS